MSRVFGPAKARATVKTNITAKAKNPGHVIIMCSLVLLCMFCVFLRIFVRFCMVLHVFGGFCALGVILDARGALLGILGSILAALGTLLGALGALLAALGALLGALGALLGALGALLEPCWPYLAKKHRKNQKKTEILEPTWEAKWSQNH